MKNTVLSGCLILSTLLLSHCDDDSFNCIQGSGQVVSEERELAEFKTIILNGSAQVLLTQGFIQEVSVEAEDNLLPSIITQVSGEILTIDFENCVNQSEAIIVNITIPVIEGIQMSGSGHVEGTNPIVGEMLEIQITGSGSLTLDLTYDEVDATTTGSGNINLSGAVMHQSIRLTGSGNYYAAALLSQHCEVTATGSGSAEVNVSDTLTATLTGSGNVVYEGDPVINSSVTGSGRVIKK